MPSSRARAASPKLNCSCGNAGSGPHEHAKEVCEELTRRGLGARVRWYTYATPAGFTFELATAMRAAGCVGVNFGVDSADDHMLASLGRDFGVAEVAETARV